MPRRSPTKGGPESNLRRSQRVILSLPITIRSEEAHRDASFEEVTHTLIVNAHGALIALAATVEIGQTLRLTNRRTGEEQLCHVLYVGSISDGKAQIGIEFKNPSPEFWHIAFPPDERTLPERDRATREGRPL
jgi:hypothetical protein